MAHFEHDEREWLEADGLGGFASGTVCGIRTRRYHGLLLTATTPPTGRILLVNGYDAWVETDAGTHALTSQRYVPDVRQPDGASRLRAFAPEPWPSWTWHLADGTQVQQELWVPHGHATVVLTWRLLTSPGPGPVRLVVRPFLTGRDYHALHHENGHLDTAARRAGQRVEWQPYASLPRVTSRANAAYDHAPDWYRQLRYTRETDRGLDDVEDVWAPGWLTWDLTAGDACWCLSAGDADALAVPSDDVRDDVDDIQAVVERARVREQARRRAFSSPLHRAADAYIVRRRSGATIVAGYPWFTDWGRDTFIALRGLCLATGRLGEARDILVEWAAAVSDGMVPNRFSDAGDVPEYNAVDASLWFVVAAADFIEASCTARQPVADEVSARLGAAVDAILDGYAEGTRFGIRMDADGLIACGVPGVQLTWMDAKVGDVVVTPRIGKPVEVQALWLNALDAAASGLFGSMPSERWRALFARGRAAFERRFWNETAACLFDVIDVDHEFGRVDASVRPNQIVAVGGLRVPLLNTAQAASVVSVVERDLLTPFGLRSLAPGDPAYTPHYEGGPWQRDHAYHQGTVWPWLLGAFVDAWLHVHGDTPEHRAEARTRFVAPLHAHLDDAGIGHVSEIADGDAPHTPRGCPFQAWSVGELLRVMRRLGMPPGTEGTEETDAHRETEQQRPPLEL